MTGGGMLERLGTGGGGAGAERAGMMGGPEVEVVVAGGMTFGLGGMYGAPFSPSSAVFGTDGTGLVESARFSRRGIGAGAAASGRAAATGAGATVEFPTGMTPTAESGLGAGTGTWVGFPAGRTPTGRLVGSGGGGPRPEKPGGRAGGRLDGGGRASTSLSSEFCLEDDVFKACTTTTSRVLETLATGFPIVSSDRSVEEDGDAMSACLSSLGSLWFLMTAVLCSPVLTL